MEEACRLCREDPHYSLGKKLQIYMIRGTTDVRHKKKHLQELMDSLSPEEEKIYREEVQPLKMGKMVKDEMKSRMKRAKNRRVINRFEDYYLGRYCDQVVIRGTDNHLSKGRGIGPPTYPLCFHTFNRRGPCSPPAFFNSSRGDLS